MKKVSTIETLIKELQKIKKKVGNRPVFLATHTVDGRVDMEFSLERIGIEFESITYNDRPAKAVVISCANPETVNQFGSNG